MMLKGKLQVNINRKLMSDIHDSCASIGMCECIEFCKRWWYDENNVTGGFCPYVPETISNGGNNCKALKNNIFNMKMTLIEKEK